MAFGALVLTASQNLPASLLTPIAADLNITEGLAGQTVTATAVIGLVTSLLIAATARKINRRILLLTFLILLIVSNLTVALVPNLPALFLGRMILGLAVGGFWTFNAALAMRLAPATFVPRALSIIFSGVAIATIAAASVASYMGDIFSWRSVFLGVTVLSILALVWQYLALPSMPPQGRTRFATVILLLKQPQVRIGMLGVILSFGGNVALVTYVRPFLEIVTQVDIRELSGILLLFGIANFIGTSLAGMMLKWNLRLTLTFMLLLMSVLAGGLILFGNLLLVTSLLLALWGFASGSIPVGWSTWLTLAIPNEAESGGGLLVAAIQLAITLGAATGGVAFDRSGTTSVVALSGIVLLLCSLAIVFGIQSAAPDSRITYDHAA
jgi:predicted MFS family arabinose efflux permease